MPTYEYYCPKCKKKYDYFQGIKDAPLARCLHCKKVKPERLISCGSGLIFKGSGFYITDYKNKAAATSKPAEKGGAAKENAKPASDNQKTESKKPGNKSAKE